MTDEQLERIARRAEMTLCPENRHTWDGELATGCLALIADYRRLRELEQAVRAIMRKRNGMWLMFPGCLPGQEQGWSYSNDAITAIGRLLEGEQ